MKKQFAVIGLGRFGLSVATTLYDMGHEVLAIDLSEERIHKHLEDVTQALQADSTDEQTMKEIGIRNCDVVVVAIGEDIQASILTTLVLVELGVKKIVVKAQNVRHGEVLHKVGAHRVFFPERDMGARVAHHLVSPNVLDLIELADDYSIVEISVPEDMAGKTLKKLDLRAKHGTNVMAIKCGHDINVAPQAEDEIRAGDILVVIGHNQDLRRLEEKM